MLVKLIGNAIMRKHDPIDGDDLFDELRMKTVVLVNFRRQRNRVGESDWWVHAGISFLGKTTLIVSPMET
jgi:hypothetical protein